MLILFNLYTSRRQLAYIGLCLNGVYTRAVRRPNRNFYRTTSSASYQTRLGRRRFLLQFFLKLFVCGPEITHEPPIKRSSGVNRRRDSDLTCDPQSLGWPCAMAGWVVPYGGSGTNPLPARSYTRASAKCKNWFESTAVLSKAPLLGVRVFCSPTGTVTKVPQGTNLFSRQFNLRGGCTKFSILKYITVHQN